MPTIKDLIRSELDHGKSVRDLEIDSGGSVKFQTFQALSNHPPRQFPKAVETIRGMARALRVDETAVVLAYAKSLGVPVAAGSLFALRLPPDVDGLEPQMQNALIGVIRAAVQSPQRQSQRRRGSLEEDLPVGFDDPGAENPDLGGGLGAVGRG